MNNKNYIIDAVMRRDEVSVCGIAAVPLTVLGCGMRRALPMVLEVISARGSCAICAYVSEIEATVTVPRKDAARVMQALSTLISQGPKAYGPRNKV